MSKSLFIHRRDLRLTDNAALYKALKQSNEVYCIFIFDTNILSKLKKNDQRVLFIYEEIKRLKVEYRALGSELFVYFGNPIDITIERAKSWNVEAVYANRDYEPYAHERDAKLFELLKAENIQYIGAKDHVIFEKNEVVKQDGKPYTVFTPYMKTWKAKLNAFYASSYPTEKYFEHLQKNELQELLTIEDIGFSSEVWNEFPSTTPQNNLIQNYAETRDIPAVNGTSRLSVHLRFGTVSIREWVRRAQELNEKFLNELIWRDFYQMILFHFPHSVKGSFRPEYDRIQWEHNEIHFKAWCAGKTGYPMVDAGMRELNATGHMHNRVRMVVASFLTKHLLIDWRLGEAYFAEKLLDFELASNVGGWQWAAGSGCDAAPYFRVFNPTSQQQKFDPEFKYIKKWVPEFGTPQYPAPIVEHKFARERVLARYKEALKG